MPVDFRTFPWEPSSSIVETLEWKTDVITGVSGSEQRISVRRYPRQSFEVHCSFTSSYDQANAHLAINAGQDQVWGFPCWHEAQQLSSSLLNGSVSIPADTTTSEYRENDYAILWQSSTVFEVVSVSSVLSGSIELDTATVEDFPAGTLVMPLRRAHISPIATITDRKANNGVISVTFSCLDNPQIITSASAIQHIENDVLTDTLLMSSSTRDRAIERNLWNLDNLGGEWTIKATGDYPKSTTEHFWKTTSASASWELRNWIHRRAGRLLPVWIPTRTDDLVVAAPINPLSANITIKDIGLRSYWDQLPGKKNVALITDSGACVIHSISAVSAGSVGEEVVTLSTVAGVSNVSTVSFLSLHRLSADRVEIVWSRPGWAEIKASMIEVPA